MRRILIAALAAAVLFCPRGATATTQTWTAMPAASSGTISSTGTCPSGLFVIAPGSGTAEITVNGTFSGTLAVKATGNFTTFSSDLTVYPRAGGAGAATMTAPGIWTLPVMADLAICVYGQSISSGTANVDLSFSTNVARVVVSNTAADPLFISGSFSSSGTADVVSAGAPTTFNGNAVCTGSLLTAGEQSAGFHLDSGTLGATFTPQCSSATSGTTNFTNGQFSDRLGAKADTLVVTNPNAQADFTIVCPVVVRRVQVCTTAFTGGSATGLANATFFQAAAAASGGGGGVVTQSTGTNLHTVTDATSVTAATQSGTWTVQPGNTANTTAWKVDGSAVTQPVSLATTGHGTATGAVRVELPTDGTGVVGIVGTVNNQGLGTANSPSGGVVTFQPPSGSTIPMAVYTPGGAIAANAADNPAVAATLNSACTSTGSCTAAQAIQWPMAGSQGATVTITAISSPVGIALACDESWDGTSAGGATWLLGGCDLWQRGAYRTSVLANADLTAATQWFIYAPGSPSNIRIRASTFTSGSVTVAGRGTAMATQPFPFWAKTPTPNTTGGITTTTETTLIAAGGSGIFLDLTYFHCSNLTSTATQVDLRDATAGTVRDTFACQAAIGPCEGQVYAVPWRQTASNNNWTVKLGTAVGGSGVACSAQAVPR